MIRVVVIAIATAMWLNAEGLALSRMAKYAEAGLAMVAAHLAALGEAA